MRLFHWSTSTLCEIQPEEEMRGQSLRRNCEENIDTSFRSEMDVVSVLLSNNSIASQDCSRTRWISRNSFLSHMGSISFTFHISLSSVRQLLFCKADIQHQDCSSDWKNRRNNTRLDIDIEAAAFHGILIAFMLIGTMGNVLNLFIFKRSALLRSPCTLYLLVASIDNLLLIYTSLFTRLLANGFGIDVSISSSAVCRLRYYISYILLALSPYFFILACYDRYCLISTSAFDRSKSSHRFAKRSILVATILACLLCSHMAGFYQLQDTSNGFVCNCQPGIYEYFYRYFYLLAYCLGPSALMTYLCLLSSMNIQKQSQRIQPSLPMSQDNRYRRLDRQLICMLLSQVATQLLCSLPYGIVNILLLCVENDGTLLFLQQIFILPMYVGYITSFYVYALASRLYRQELYKVFRMQHWDFIIWARLCPAHFYFVKSKTFIFL